MCCAHKINHKLYQIFTGESLSPIILNQAIFKIASQYPHQWPDDSCGEVAFAGRSNVGKSSAINAISGQQRLAKTSKTPGRTQQIVFFHLPDNHYLVDLPGYGYAKAPVKLRMHWETFVTDYLVNRESLRALFIPMDIRRPLTELDMTMLTCCWEIGLPAHILLTKADKFKLGRAKNLYQSVSREMECHILTTVQLFSARSRLGVEDARTVLIDFLNSNNN